MGITMNLKRIIKTALLTISIITIFTFTVLSVYLHLSKKFGVPDDVLTRAQNIIIEIRSGVSGKQIKEKDHKNVLLNLIIKQAGENDKLEAFLLEVINVTTGELLLMTLPGDTKITMSNELYVALQSEFPTIPQMIFLENIVIHTGNGNEYKYVRQIIEDFLGLKFSYDTVISREIFDLYFTQTEEGYFDLTAGQKLSFSLPVTVRNIMKQMDELYADSNTISSMPLSEKYWYLEYYEGLRLSSIILGKVEGEQTNEAYFPDVIKIKQKIYEYQKE